MASARRLVIVGASLGGLRTAEEARELGFDDPITIVGKEEHLPYDRPPLSKQVLSGAWPADKTTLRSAAEISGRGIELCLGDPARELAPGQVTLRSGRRLPYDDLVIATGATARRLPGQPADERIHTLRTLEDSLALRAQLARARSVLIIGGGFIGAEVAVTARAANLDVTIVEALSVPFERVLGPQVGQYLAQVHRDHGVTVRTGGHVQELITRADAVGVRLADGSVLEADCMVVGVGSVPGTDWLAGSGIPVANGILCDEDGRTAAPGRVYAVGDVAAWRSPRFGDQPRLEHWSSALDQARQVAGTLAGHTGPVAGRPPLPYFWSDQYDLRLQLVGRPDVATEVQLLVPPDHPERLIGNYYRDDRLVAAVVFGSARHLARCRPLVECGADGDTVNSAWPGFTETGRSKLRG